MRQVQLIRALFGLCLLCSQFAQATENGDKPVSVEFYVAEADAADGLKQAKVEGGNDEPIYLHPAPVLARDDIAQTRVVIDDFSKRPLIDVTFTKPGQAKMGKATEENIGKRLAIVVDGKVISAPFIRSKIGERAQISGSFDKAEAEKLAKNIRPADPKSP
jgi:preprotein translocase subunit SecD